MSSFIIFLTMVVLPALSRPLCRNQSPVVWSEAASATHSIRIRISLSFNRAFLNIDNILGMKQFVGEVGAVSHCHFQIADIDVT